MVKNVLLGFASVALAVASAASYNVTFYQPVTINGAQLKAGDYKLELKDNNTAVLKQGKSVTEASVKVENDSQKFSRNAVRMNGEQAGRNPAGWHQHAGGVRKIGQRDQLK